MTDATIKDFADLCSFLGWAEEDKAMYGAVKATQAVEAFSRISGFTPDQIRAVAWGGQKKEPECDHDWRGSDASSYDLVCKKCGKTD